MAAEFDAELTYFSSEIDRIRRELAYVDMTAISGNQDLRVRGALSKAFIYVWLCSILEKTVRDVLSNVLRVVAASGQPYSKIRNSLFALISDSSLESISSVNRHNSWKTRVEMFDLLSRDDIVHVSNEVIPVGSRTLRGEHFDRIWTVYGFRSPSLPTPIHGFALRDLADGRNDIAHGHVEPEKFGRTKAVADVRNLVSRIEDVGEHLILCSEAYVQQREYLR